MVDTYQGATTREYIEFYSQKPQEILIETVGPCNLRCIGCPQALESYRAKKWKPAFMDFELYKSILAQAKELWPPINVGLYHTGEITLMPDDIFDKYTWKAKEILNDHDGWDSVGFYTNGLKLTKAKRETIIRNNINWVRLSFDGGDKESYEKVRVGSNFEAVLENAKALARDVDDCGRKIRLEVIFVPYRENEDSIEAFRRLWRHSGWTAMTGGAMNYAGTMEFAVSGRRHKEQRQARERHSVPCPRVFEQFAVLVDGRVSLCSADPMAMCELGDLKRKTVKEVWEGRIRRSILKLHTDMSAGMMRPCDACDYTEYCAVPKGEYFGEKSNDE